MSALTGPTMIRTKYRSDAIPFEGESGQETSSSLDRGVGDGLIGFPIGQ